MTDTKFDAKLNNPEHLFWVIRSNLLLQLSAVHRRRGAGRRRVRHCGPGDAGHGLVRRGHHHGRDAAVAGERPQRD